MLSIGVIVPAGIGYYMETVGSGVDDYYARTEPGRWTGAGAAALGLAGTVEAAQIDALVAGRHPLSGEILTARPGKVAAFDLTFSAPKSVSLLAELADATVRAETVEAHRHAVAATVGFLEDQGVIAGRRGHAGARHVDTTGAVAAAFDHRTSRAGDPQLHTHLLLFNRAEGVDGRWGALDGRRVFGWAKTAGYIYQSALRAELSRRLGVDWRPTVNGTADVAGVPDRVLATFSSRRSQIETELAATGHTSARAAQLATLSTRPSKPEPIDPETQRHAWREQAAAVGIDEHLLRAVTGPAVSPFGMSGWDVRAAAGDLAAPDGLTAHRSAFDRLDVIRAVAEANDFQPHDVLAATDAILGWYQFAPTGSESRLGLPLYSTVELMQTERRLAGAADRLGVTPEAGPADVAAALDAHPTLSEEQEAMVRRLCGQGRAVEVVVGRGGTGKTYSLDACRQAWTETGIPVVGAALAARTAAGMQAGTGIPSATIDQLLSDLGRPGSYDVLPRRGVLVVDEAGLVGTRKLAALIDAAERARCRVVLVGDPKQLPEVEAGGLFAVLARTDPVQLTVNRRQEQAWERAALDELRHGDVTKAVTVYRDRQRITLAPTAEAARDALVADWWAAGHDPERHLMVALGNADVDDLNRRARHLMRSAGQLGGPAIEAGDGRTFAVGDHVMALHNDRRLGITNGTRATVTGVDTTSRQLTVNTADGRQLTIPGEYLDAGHLTYGLCLTAHKAQGMTVDRAFVLGSDRLYREAGYVALSRARQRSDLYQVALPPTRFEPTEAPDPYRDLAHQLTRSGAQTPASPELHPANPELHPSRPEPGLDRRAIRDAALADPGAHLLDRLGPPPPAGPARDAWAAAATAIDTYRHQHHITGTDPLGPRPSAPEQARQWDHAQALTQNIDRSRHLEIDHGLNL